MFPSRLPSSLPSPGQRRALAREMLDPSGRGLHGGFRMPDQALIWSGANLSGLDKLALVTRFQKDKALASVFWLVPKEKLETGLSTLHQVLARTEGVNTEKGCVGIWETLPDGEPQDVLVGWVGSEAVRVAFEGAVASVGLEGKNTGVNRIIFEDHIPSPLGGKELVSGQALSDRQDTLLWEAMSRKTEGSLYAGTYIVELLPLVLLLMVAAAGVVFVCSSVTGGSNGLA